MLRNKFIRQCKISKYFRYRSNSVIKDSPCFSFKVSDTDFSVFDVPHGDNTKKKTVPPVSSISTKKTTGRRNSVNIQMLSESLYTAIFGDEKSSVDPKMVEKCLEELKKYGLGHTTQTLPGIDIKIPKLEGKNIEEHFKIIGDNQSAPYRILINNLIEKNPLEIPKNFLKTPGWTKYSRNKEPESVPYPDETALIFDVEVSVTTSEAPILATALSPNAWYGWVSPFVCEDLNPPPVTKYLPNMFLPLEGKKRDGSPRIIVGHNVSYDRIRVREQYLLNQSGLRFLDTMSMHICIGGITSFQRSQLKNKNPVDEEPWREYSSLNSLKELFKFYCKKDLVKEGRNIFVEGSLADIRENFADLMHYCAADVVATFEILRKLWPLFLDRFPHPVTLAGMLEMGTAYLPVNNNWEKYLENSEETFNDLEMECKFLLSRKTDQACHLHLDGKFKEDLWMWDEDWSTQDLKLTKRDRKGEKEETIEEKFQNIFETGKKLPVNIPHLPGYPLWYRKLCEKPAENPDWVFGPVLVSTSVKVAPKILKLTWEGFPLFHTRQYGWGILMANLNREESDAAVPFEKLKKITLEKLKNDRKDLEGKEELKLDDVVDGCYFVKLPHKNGLGNNVGNPLARDFLKTFSKSVLAGADGAAERVLEIGRMLSYWRNNRERIMSQIVCWMKPNMGAILPQVVVSGTLTRRAMEPTWMTASNVQTERIGSELRAMVQSPPGYHFVGADVDSQELWIASVIGDASMKIHGATPFGWMTLSGSKSSATDMHSVTAAAAGISRDHAKVINYARIYGAGTRFAQRLLKQFNPSMSEQEAKSKANKMFILTKGKKFYRIRGEFREQLPAGVEEIHSLYSALRIAKILGKPVETVFEPGEWQGGTESTMFNRLEKIANSERPQTPFLQARLSRAIEYPREAFLPTRINWVVQSGAVDFLHLMLVCIRWLSQGRMRFCLSFHDEVRYLVPSELRYEAALVLHLTNLLTRSFCVYRLGMRDLPMSVAFFSSVEVDTVLRKDAANDCVTPSNPHGLTKGYGMPLGEALDIYQIIEKTEMATSRATKKKYVQAEILQAEPKLPEMNQQIVQVESGQGNNLYQVRSAHGDVFLVSMPMKFRKTVWVKRGDFVVVENIETKSKIKGEMVTVLTAPAIKFIKNNSAWPPAFNEDYEDNDKNVHTENISNPNRITYDNKNSSETESE